MSTQPSPRPNPHSVSELYPLEIAQEENVYGPAGSAMRQITAAWSELEALESNLQGGPDRWQAESLFVAREGMRRAWLALSHLDRRVLCQDRAARRALDVEDRQ